MIFSVPLQNENWSYFISFAPPVSLEICNFYYCPSLIHLMLLLLAAPFFGYFAFFSEYCTNKLI